MPGCLTLPAANAAEFFVMYLLLHHTRSGWQLTCIIDANGTPSTASCSNSSFAVVDLNFFSRLSPTIRFLPARKDRVLDLKISRNYLSSFGTAHQLIWEVSVRTVEGTAKVSFFFRDFTCNLFEVTCVVNVDRCLQPATIICLFTNAVNVKSHVSSELVILSG